MVVDHITIRVKHSSILRIMVTAQYGWGWAPICKFTLIGWLDVQSGPTG